MDDLLHFFVFFYSSEEIDALCESLADLVQDHLPFQGLQVIPEAEDELVTLGRLEEFRYVSDSQKLREQREIIRSHLLSF